MQMYYDIPRLKHRYPDMLSYNGLHMMMGTVKGGKRRVNTQGNVTVDLHNPNYKYGCLIFTPDNGGETTEIPLNCVLKVSETTFKVFFTHTAGGGWIDFKEIMKYDKP